MPFAFADDRPCVTFLRAIPAAPLPVRADRAPLGTLPVRAARYCDAVTQASSFGWWLFSPLNMQLLFDGQVIHWTYEGGPDWMPLDAVQYPGFAQEFDATAPSAMRGFSPPLLTSLPEPGTVQIWSGLLARTAADWSLLIRGPANLPRTGWYDVYEGIVEADRWLAPIFVNIRITRTDTPIRLSSDLPLMQVQPLHRLVYASETLSSVHCIRQISEFTDDDWADYRKSVVDPSLETDRPLGAYATAARRRRKREKCPFLHATGRS